MKFGEDWTSCFGDVLNRLWTDKNFYQVVAISEPWSEFLNDVWVKNRKKKTHRINLPYSRTLSGAAKNTILHPG